MKTSRICAVVALLLVAPLAMAEVDVPLLNWTVVIPPPARLGHKGMMITTDALNLNATFVPIAPCRLVDTRIGIGGAATPYSAGETRTYSPSVMPSCSGIPGDADAYSLNFSVLSPQNNGFLTAYQAGGTQPNTATLSYAYGAVASNNSAIVPSGAGGAFSVYSSAGVQVIIDINGYFGSPATESFARVIQDGTILPPITTTTPFVTSKNITNANITHPATGVYCIVGLSFNPSHGMVSLDNAGVAALATNQIASIAVERGNNLLTGGCPSNTNARIYIIQLSDTAPPVAADGRFNVWLGR